MTGGERRTANWLAPFIVICLETKISVCSFCSCVSRSNYLLLSFKCVIVQGVKLKADPTHGLYVNSLCYTASDGAVCSLQYHAVRCQYAE